MNERHGLYALLMMFVSGAASACDLPTLVAIPAADSIGDDSARLIVAVQRYVDGIKGYTACVQAELAAAGGDAAPESLRNQLVVRNNGAVAEAGAVLALFGERLTPARNLYVAEFIAGDGEECVQTPRLESTAVINDIAVLYIERDGGAHLNVLEKSCPNLDRFGRFDTERNVVGGGDVSRLGPVWTNRLCSNEFIEPYKFDTSEVPQRECALGRFFALTEDQATRLMALRAAIPEAAESAPESADAPGEETPAPPRTER
jgi:hypothetical protein